MSGRREFLLEIGAEEIPAGFLPGVIDQLAGRGRSLFEGLRLGAEAIRVQATPRRLVLRARVAPRQDEATEEARGPAVKAAFDAEGRPTRAAEGFARSQGLAVEELVRRETPQGEYLFAVRRVPGRPALEVLAEALPAWIAGLEFPKSMRWGSGDLRFARPLRWLLALLGEEVIPFELAGLRSDRLTYGHRTLGPGPFPVPDPSRYDAILREQACVLVDPEERREAIRRQVAEAAREVGGEARIDEGLLAEVVHLVEWPTAFAGSFPAAYLEVPRPVLVTTMRNHQRYFPVEGPGGDLEPHFVAVRNGGREHLDLVRAGNEKVLRARLADARFFFEEDRRRPLEAFLPRLASVVFQARLGTMAQKAERVRRLAGWLAGELGLPEEERRHLDRAALLCKADLVTSVVYEFPELQGEVGAAYARLDGEPEPVAQAIGEHHLPRGAGDGPAASRPGRCLAIADKVDTLAGCFAAGIQPTGSADPFGLRRQALGILHTLRAAAFPLALRALLSRALDGYRAQGIELEAARPGRAREEVLDALDEFVRGRLRGLLSEEGYRHDQVEAALGGEGGCDRLPDFLARLEALREAEGDPALWADLLAVHRRAAHLAGKAEGGTEVEEALLREPEERDLYERLRAAEQEADRAGGKGAPGDPARPLAVLRAVASLRPAVDAFLDAVFVMDPDERVRRNRLAILARVAAIAGRVADLSPCGHDSPPGGEGTASPRGV